MAFVLQACLLPTPKGASCANYARCLNQILQNLGSMQVPFEHSHVNIKLSNFLLMYSLGKYCMCLCSCPFPFILIIIYFHFKVVA